MRVRREVTLDTIDDGGSNGRCFSRVTARFPAGRFTELHAAFDQFFALTDVSGPRVRSADRVPMVTAAAEIAANISRHACKDRPDAEVGLTLSRFAHHIEATFEDAGVPFSSPADAAAIDADDVREGVRGLAVARESVHAL